MSVSRSRGCQVPANAPIITCSSHPMSIQAFSIPSPSHKGGGSVCSNPSFFFTRFCDNRLTCDVAKQQANVAAIVSTRLSRKTAYQVSRYYRQSEIRARARPFVGPLDSNLSLRTAVAAPPQSGENPSPHHPSTSGVRHLLSFVPLYLSLCQT